MSVNFSSKYSDFQKLADESLSGLLPANNVYPELIHEAMNYSLLAGGKRLRPVLCASVFNLFSDKLDCVKPVICALECIHTYSLIHDDLPCMDNDDVRRGLPTCHKKFGEAIAVLAGDALLTEAFALAASFYDKSKTADLIMELASSCGSRGLIGGQVMDILSENKKITEDTLLYIHEHKTGKLILASVRLGAVCAGASEIELEALTAYGRWLGLAFQISDDILDVTGNSEDMGKKAGQDEKLNKATYPSIYGVEASKDKLNQAINEACGALGIFNERGWFLKELAMFVGYRDR